MQEPVGKALDWNLGSPTAPGEDVEAANDALIAKRHAERVRDDGERVVEELWKAQKAAGEPGGGG